MQTKIFRNSNNPSYQESFLFFISKQNIKRSLWFHLYHTNAHCTTLIGNYANKLQNNIGKLNLFQGETELKVTEFRKPITTWLQLTDSRNNFLNCGDLMFSLSYLPTAERLTVCVGKARNLKPCNDENENQAADIQNVFVKVISCHSRWYLMWLFHTRKSKGFAPLLKMMEINLDENYSFA